MEIKLQRLSLKNFKGLASFDLELNGENVAVYGDNATGKTTLADAFRWLFFGKDSLDQTNFEIKPLGPDGNPRHGLEHGVAAQLSVGSQRITLRKVYQEKWTKKRGSAEKEFTGHTTDYFIDGVPVKLKEYQQQISELCSEDLFKMLTNPRYFNEVMHWQKRRELLLAVCGDVSDADVIASDHSLVALPGILSGRDLDDHKKVLVGRRTEINRELDKIPVRIDELQQSIVESDAIDVLGITAELAALRSQLADKQKERVSIRSGGEIAEKTKALREIEARIIELQNQQSASNRAAIEEKHNELGALKKEQREIQIGLDGALFKIANTEGMIQGYEQDIVLLRAKWIDVDAVKFTDDSTCPTCGQSMPEEKVEKSREIFNLEKAEKLACISVDGKKLKENVAAFKAEIAKLQAQAEDCENKLNAIGKKVAAKEAEIKQLQPMPEATAHTSPELAEALAGKDILKAALSELAIDSHDAESVCRDEIEALTEKIQWYESTLAKVESTRNTRARIEELKKQERKFAGEFEELEREWSLCEQFVRVKVAMLDEKINSKFQLAKFRLFTEQINGGLAESCEVTYGGVPYSSLNNSMRINIGLDLINTLSDHYKVSVPVFIDNAESVTNLLPTKAQQIRLIVSEQDKTLRIVTDQNAEQQAA